MQTPPGVRLEVAMVPLGFLRSWYLLVGMTHRVRKRAASLHLICAFVPRRVFLLRNTTVIRYCGWLISPPKSCCLSSREFQANRLTPNPSLHTLPAADLGDAFFDPEIATTTKTTLVLSTSYLRAAAGTPSGAGRIMLPPCHAANISL